MTARSVGEVARRLDPGTRNFVLAHRFRYGSPTEGRRGFLNVGVPIVEGDMGMKGDEMVCDYCGAAITKVTSLPAEGWPHLHAVCAPCFQKLREKPA